MASEEDVHAGALDADVTISKEKMLTFIRELTDKVKREHVPAVS